MRIITDTRENRNQRILEAFCLKGIDFKVKKLEFGDYSIEGYEDKICIERKQNLTELAGNFTNGRARFEAEFIRAMEAGAKMYLLIEDEKSRDKMALRQAMDTQKVEDKIKFAKTWRSQFSGNSMVASIVSWMKKYNFDIIFCSKGKSGEKIIEIFNNYLRQNDS
jgi:ERCC4-type nuclease